MNKETILKVPIIPTLICLTLVYLYNGQYFILLANNKQQLYTMIARNLNDFKNI